MKGPGDRDTRVTIKLIRQDTYDRVRPQGGRCFRAFQSLGAQHCRDAGERNSQPGCLPQRRGGARCTRTLVESATDGGRKTGRVRGLPGITANQTILNRLPFRSGQRLPVAVPSFFLLLIILLLSGCGGHKNAKVQVPSPPALPGPTPESSPARAPKDTPTVADQGAQDERIEVPAGTKPVFEESGMASWYGAPYHNRRGSNGEVYDMNAMTAAHRTLPLGSIVRVTNVKTGHAAIVRITDRGPFIEGRILDLSLAAAKALDVYQPGVARVRLEVLKVPSPLDTGGRWAVQIGSFADKKNASDVADHLQRRYRTAKVLRFASPVGDWWVRVRVLDDDRERAQTLARETETSEGAVFLVRLD
jgi:rare lipoprotein A